MENTEIMFEWKTEYETGIDLIDLQHKKLFEIGRKGFELLNNYNDIDKQAIIVDIILELKKYTIYHFSTEENYLRNINYKEFAKHINEHEEFIKKFNAIDLINDSKNQDSYLQEVVEFVYKWIDHHILSEDLKYI